MGRLIDIDAREDAELAQGFGNLIQSDARGYLYAAHINNSGNLEIHWSYNNGIDWYLDTTFSEGVAIEQPFLCRDWNSGIDNDIYVSYSYGVASPYGFKVYRRDAISGTWTLILSDTPVYSDNGKLKICLCFNELTTGRLHAFWVVRRTSTNEKKIINKYSDNKGTTWTNGTDYSLSGTAGAQYYGAEIDRNGTSIYFTLWSNYNYFYWTFKFNNSGLNISYFNTAWGEVPETYYGSNTLITRNERLWHAHFAYSSYYSQYQLQVFYTALSAQNWISSIYEVGVSILGGYSIRKGTLFLSSDGNNNVYLYYVKASSNPAAPQNNKAFFRKLPFGGTWGSEQVFTSHFRINIEKHNKWTSDKLDYVYFDTV